MLSPEPPTLLCLDMARVTGWVCGTGEGLPETGYITLAESPGGVRGPAFHQFRLWLFAKLSGIQDSGRDVILIFEQPILPKPFIRWEGRKPIIVWSTNIQVTLFLQGLAAIAEEVAENLGVDCHYVDVSTVKKELAGFGGADKDDMVYVAEKVGLKIDVHDQADALGVFVAALRVIDRKLSAQWDSRIYGARGLLI